MEEWFLGNPILNIVLNSLMKTIDYAEANLPLADYARRLKKAPVIITKEGKPLAALISLINADMETISLSNNPKFVAIIERSYYHRFKNLPKPPVEKPARA